MKAVVFTLGCKVNSCESNSILKNFKDKGYDVSDELGYADVYVINTCAVTKEAEKKSRQAISRCRKFNPNAEIIVTGCASEKHPEDFFKKDGVTLVTGTRGKSKISERTGERRIDVEKQSRVYEEAVIQENLKTRAFVKVQDGCDNFCSYCIIPYLRGRSRSRSIESIKAEIEKLKPVETVLTAINLTAYNYEGKTVTDLIYSLKDCDTRIRLGSLEENIITRDFLKSLESLKDFAPHFHLSLQSGSDKVLKDMNRKYTVNEFLNGVSLIREYFPNAAVTTDIIVGYPTETEEDFLKTLKTAEEAEFSDIHCFPYSEREGTASSKLSDLPYDVKKDRLNRLTKIKKSLKSRFISKNIGKIQNVVVECEEGGFLTGYTANYIKVYITGSALKTKLKVKLLKAYKDGAFAEIIKE